MKKGIIVGVVAVFAIVLSIMVVRGTFSSSDEIPIIIIDMKDWVYSPSYIMVPKGVPVRIMISDNVQGCFRDIVFEGVDVNKLFVDDSDYVDITFPEGRFIFRCSMNMGRGTIIAQ